MNPKPPDPPDPPDSITPIEVDVVISGTKRRHDEVVEKTAKKVNADLAVPSIQTVYTHPSLVVGAVQTYTTNDKGPFIVHVSRKEADPSTGSIIKPLKFGQFLSTHKIKNVCRDGVQKVGRNKIAVVFVTAEDANNFITNPILSMCKYEAVIPMYNVTRMGLVRGVPTELSMDKFGKDAIVPTGCGNILKARRLNRKVTEDGITSWVPTQTVVVTFHGQ